MATTLQAQHDAAYGPTDFTFPGITQARIDAAHFVERVTMAVAAAAQSIGAEATTTNDHANRVALAKAASSNPSQWGLPFAVMLAAQGLDQNASTDAQINNMVSAVWNTIAGAL